MREKNIYHFVFDNNLTICSYLKNDSYITKLCQRLIRQAKDCLSSIL